MTTDTKPYLLLIHGNETMWEEQTREELAATMAGDGAFTESIRRTGSYLASERLQPTSTATTVRVRDGKALITDGPFAETKEQLGGFFAVSARSMDEAVAIGSRIPGAKDGSVEVRPAMRFNAADAAPTPGKKTYLLMMHEDRELAQLPPPQREAMIAEYAALTENLQQSKHWVASVPLHEPQSGKVVRVRDGKLLVTDGPFAETKEQLGGLYVVRAEHLDEALAIARRVPGARIGSVEVRPAAAMEG